MFLSKRGSLRGIFAPVAQGDIGGEQGLVRALFFVGPDRARHRIRLWRGVAGVPRPHVGSRVGLAGSSSRGSRCQSLLSAGQLSLLELKFSSLLLDASLV